MKFTYNAYAGWAKKMFFFVVIFSLSSIIAFSQRGPAVTVSGTVSLGGGAPDIAGTTVQVKGKSTAVSTDSKGHYTISAQKEAVLVFSHVGFQSIEKTVNDASDINVS